MKRPILLVGVAAFLSVVLSGIIWYTGRNPATPESSDRVLGESERFDALTPAWEPSPTPVPNLSLDRIFSPDHSWVRALPPERTVTVIATGDVIPARSVNYKMVTMDDFRWPFEKTKDILAAADLTVINLETPLLADCIPTTEGMIFCGKDRAVEGLVAAGVDVATLGNNHAGNHGKEGVEETRALLLRNGILPVAGDLQVKTVKGTRFAFLSYNDIGTPEDGVPWADEVTIREDIKNARKTADTVIVAYHWGVEYVTMPTEHQRQLAHFTIDNGADAVFGNHPHWIQPVEFYKDKLIVYAQGNFVFDQEWSVETKLGVVGRYVFFDNRLVDVEYLPVKIVNYGQPYFLSGDESARVLKGMEDASRQLSGY